MAATLGERVGDTVGYRMRLDTRVSARTRIEVVTEGVFTRMLQSDPALERVGGRAVRRVSRAKSERGLGSCARARRAAPRRAGAALARDVGHARRRARRALLGDAPVIESAARMHAVEMHYLGKGLPRVARGYAGRRRADRRDRRARRRSARSREVARRPAACFCPAPAEIRRVQARLRASGSRRGRRRAAASTAICRRPSRTPRSSRRARGGARSCSRPTSPRRASRSTACAASSTRGSSGAACSIRGAA